MREHSPSAAFRGLYARVFPGGLFADVSRDGGDTILVDMDSTQRATALARALDAAALTQPESDDSLVPAESEWSASWLLANLIAVSEARPRPTLNRVNQSIAVAPDAAQIRDGLRKLMEAKLVRPILGVLSLASSIEWQDARSFGDDEKKKPPGY